MSVESPICAKCLEIVWASVVSSFHVSNFLRSFMTGGLQVVASVTPSSQRSVHLLHFTVWGAKFYETIRDKGNECEERTDCLSVSTVFSLKYKSVVILLGECSLGYRVYREVYGSNISYQCTSPRITPRDRHITLPIKIYQGQNSEL